MNTFATSPLQLGSVEITRAAARPARFTAEDAERAHDEWGANCGPGAIAGIMHMTLDEVRPHMGDFEERRYTNPTLMLAALRSIGRPFESLRRNANGVWDFPFYGLCRVQWEGPWTEPGVPMRARYRHTHWIGVCHPKGSVEVGIFDINQINNGSAWARFADWRDITVPWLLEDTPRATGTWHLTHAIEVEP